jgi:flagellar basal body-associated protein FliL
MWKQFEETWRDPEKKAKLLFWIWILSMIMTVVGYAIIFFTLLR